MFLILLISCIEKVKVHSIENTSDIIPEKSTELKTLRDTLFLKSNNEKLIGKYYVEYLHPKRSFYLKQEKPKNDFKLYELDFKENGKIKFKDLTEFYDGGNGILSLKNLTYKINDRKNYELEFDGEFALESRFKFNGEYKLTKTEKGEDYLYLINIIKYEETDYE